jgi:hypothetical protein
VNSSIIQKKYPYFCGGFYLKTSRDFTLEFLEDKNGTLNSVLGLALKRLAIGIGGFSGKSNFFS